ncbi:MAG: FKBP-type peptidyl-prolyl cis-trans isomerase [Nitrospiraceae bacterium]|nr:FKBP-type peptidyl-prolyl cis-trans isomerase [Nitrospiraceae bacterium]
MSVVKQGDVIRIHFTGKLEDGTVFDSSDGGASLELKVGSGEFLAGLEQGVLGMKAGEQKTVRMNAEDAYGPHRPERVFQWDRARLGELQPAIGRQLQLYRADGAPVVVTVLDLTDTTVTMDCNHPLAGKNLVFDIILEEIVQE